MSDLHKIVCSAPGKVILFGEHAVVLGKTAIATALGLRTYSYFEESAVDLSNPQSPVLKLNFPDLNVEREWTYEQLKPFFSQAPIPNDNLIPNSTFSNSTKTTFEEYIKSLETLTGEGANTSTTSKGLLAFLYLYFSLHQFNSTQSLKHLAVTVRSRLPVGMGLGSSAAFSVSIVTGLVTLNAVKVCSTSCTSCTTTRPCTQQLKFINDWSFQAERIMHGTPSGIDNTVSTYGGTVTLTRTDAEPIKFLKGTPSLPFLLTNTKVPRNTAALVKKVGVFHQEQPEKANPMLNEIHSISQKCIDSFASNIPRQELFTLLEGLIDRNQVLLTELGVGHAVLDNVCKITAQFGLHSKLTGAGGGGCALTLLSNSEVVDQAKAALEKEGFECFRAELGGDGVLLNTPEEFLSLFGLNKN